MGAQPNDWRLQGQENWLKSAALTWRTYKAPRPDWDHDHCEMCMAKFSEYDHPDYLHEGYTAPYFESKRSYRWICRECFNDFRDYMEWKVLA